MFQKYKKNDILLKKLTLMSNYKVPENLNVFHVLSLVYISFAHQSDGDFSDSERATIITKVGEWMGDDATRSQIDNTIDEAIDWYNSIPGEKDADGNSARILEMVKYIYVLKEAFTDVNTRRAVFADVVAIAEADGRFTEVEKGWLSLMKEGLDV
jgi:tellurite resistance protein